MRTSVGNALGARMAGPGFLGPALTLWQREVVRFLRQRNRVIGALGTPIVFWLLLGSGFGRSFQAPGAAAGDGGYLTYFFPGTLVLILFSDIQLSLCLLVGAVGMMTSRVLTVDEAYNAVGWNTVFLLASLIPLGQAVQNSGTAAWIASWPLWK